MRTLTLAVVVVVIVSVVVPASCGEVWGVPGDWILRKDQETNEMPKPGVDGDQPPGAEILEVEKTGRWDKVRLNEGQMCTPVTPEARACVLHPSVFGCSFRIYDATRPDQVVKVWVDWYRKEADGERTKLTAAPEGFRFVLDAGEPLRVVGDTIEGRGAANVVALVWSIKDPTLMWTESMKVVIRERP
ncbi:MAG: hypothetical protein OEV37_01635 [Candidatus Berkelbacteria bacterium]|nr:hypothetical protein [Candidatus Berkelbacteria bacterium]